MKLGIIILYLNAEFFCLRNVGLMRIRYYGFLANAVRVKAIAEIRHSLRERPAEKSEVMKEKPCCPNCHLP